MLTSREMVNFQNWDVCAFVNMIDYILENSGDPDEMQHRAAFHLGRHCLQNTR